MSWWRDNFWIILAMSIIFISLVLGLILYCVCRWQLRQGTGKLLSPQNRMEEMKKRCMRMFLILHQASYLLCHPGVHLFQET
uniref:SLP adaptor and CSK interacting membrane protein n=1 Tax=Mus musculus TaxID=10090 RepID=F8WHN0_MOUSE